jgi:TolB-like protein/Flp pilus assembly protein TadD
LRKALGDNEHRYIASDEESIVLDITAFEIDALTFRGLATQSGRAELEAAAALCPGEFLDGFGLPSEEFEAWRRAEATRYRDQAVEVFSRLMRLFAECGEVEHAIEVGTRILRFDPFHEATARLLMRLYADNGRRGAAIQLYRALAEALRIDLDTQPEAETRLVLAEIVRVSGEQPPDPASTVPVLLPGLGSAKRSDAPDASAGSQIPAPPAFRLRLPIAIFAGAFGIAIALAFYWQFFDFPLSASTARTQEIGVGAQTATVSIAVLPFSNLSGDPGQEFFSDGITEEITAALSKISSMRVVARTSAFQFKGKNEDVRVIGQALGATHVLEGSVRKDGQRLRITAQLIKVDDGTHLWTEAYDRNVSDVFATQEDIAQAIALALRTPLGLEPGERLVSSRSIDPESYQQFLRAKPLVRARANGVPQAIKILEAVAVRNPDYPPALALLSSAHAFIGYYSDNGIKEFWPKAEVEARRAIQLDPDLADGYLALAFVLHSRGNLVESEDLLLKALALDPNNPDVIDLYMLHLSNVGKLKEALALASQLRALEPYVPTFSADVGRILWENGQGDAAIDMLKPLIPLIAVSSVRANLAMMYASLGRFDEGADMLDSAAANPIFSEESKALRHQAAAILRAAPRKYLASQNSPRFFATGVPMDFIYLYTGDPERALETYEDTVKAGQVGGPGGTFGYLWHPSYAPVRKTQRFKAFVRNAGIVDLWRAKGWPPFCHPTDADDFVCE